MIGLSLAIRGAKTEMKNKTKNIQNDQKPRLLALNKAQRR
jgi:hypothetical protein